MAASTLLLRHMFSGAERLDIPLNALVEGVVDRERLQREDFWIDDEDLFEVIARALRASHRPGLGLLLGERSSWSGMGALGLHVSTLPTFQDVLATLAHFHTAFRDNQGLFLHEDESHIRFEIGALAAPPSIREMMASVLLRALSETLAQFAGADARPSCVQFNFPRPAHADDYHRAFGCEVQFDQPRSVLVVERAVAQRPQLASRPSLAAQLKLIAERQLGEWQVSDDIVARVRAQLDAGSDAATLSMVQIARRLGIGERSLRRRLARQGVDFRTLVQERRARLAGSMLLEKGVPVKHVAVETGYKSASAFYRAFKRWTGLNPSAYAANPGQSSGLSNRGCR